MKPRNRTNDLARSNDERSAYLQAIIRRHLAPNAAIARAIRGQLEKATWAARERAADIAREHGVRAEIVEEIRGS